MPSVALTDHGMAGGLLDLKEECTKANIKPIYGCEFYCAPTSKTSYHLTVLAKNEAGLRNIFRLCSIGWTDGFYYKPRCSNDLLEKYHEGLVVLSGCALSRLCRLISEEKFGDAIDHVNFMREMEIPFILIWLIMISILKYRIMD